MLRRLLLLPALAALLLPALLRADEPKVQDKDLEGDWNQVSGAFDGKDLGPPPVKIILTIKGDALTMQAGDKTEAGKVKIDASKTPKTIDLIHTDGPAKGVTNLGVYEIKDDELRIVYSDPGKDRPTEVSSKPGSGWVMATFKRIKK